MKKNEKNPAFARIQAFARCRPLNHIEKKQDSLSVVEVLPKDKKIVVKDRNKEFIFDKVFSPDFKQIDIYKSVAEPLIQEVLKGFNCTIFAYGQTGTGKTYTMEGERYNTSCSWEEDPGAGIIPRSLHQIFEELNKGDNLEFSVKVSFLELYNEELLDLLSSKDIIKLRLYENTAKKGSVLIDGLEEVVVNSKDEVYTILEKGSARRQTAATQLNASSSRSHTVFSITVYIKENTDDGEELVKIGKLNLVDLAGSECVGRSGCVNQRLREASNINMSLLTLGRVITALIEKQPHVPYRESKLTRLLQDSLGGHTKTSIIATISPAQCNLEETLSTLEYATKAKNITNKPVINEKMTKRTYIRELNQQIERLTKDLDAMRSGEGFYVDAQNYEQMEKDLENYKILLERFKELSESYINTQQQYSQKCTELSEVNEAFNNIKIVLSKIVLERDEKAVILNAHCDTEKKLTEQASGYKNLLGNVIDEKDKVHSKLDRKQKVEETNKERCNQMQHDMQNCITGIRDSSINLERGQKTSLKQWTESLDEIKTEMFNYVQMMNIFLKMVATQSTKINGISSKLNQKALEKEKWHSNLLEDVAFKENALLAHQEEFCAEILQSSMKQFADLANNVKTFFFDVLSNMCQKIEKLKTDMKTQFQSHQNELNVVISSSDDLENQCESLFTSLLEKQQKSSALDPSEIGDQMKLTMQEFNVELQTLMNVKMQKMNAFILQAKGISAQDKEIKSEIEADLESMKKNISSEIKVRKNRLIECCNGITEHETAVEVDLVDIVSTVKHSELDSKFNSITDFLDSRNSKITGFIRSNQMEQHSCLEMIKEAVDSDEKSTQIHDKAINTELLEVQSSMSESIKNYKSNLDDSKSSLQHIVSNLETNIKTAEQAFNQNKEKLSEGLLLTDLRIKKFFSEELVEDVPTGTTPQRKTYDYPKQLPHTSPDEKILHRWHLLKGKCTNEAVSLPMDSSFSDSDEFKSPLTVGLCDFTKENKGVPESKLHNTSFGSETEYSTDCDTISNASSVTDLRIDSKKENIKTFSKKSSRLPKQKRPKKVGESSIPTPTSRKPLLSKNSS